MKKLLYIIIIIMNYGSCIACNNSMATVDYMEVVEKSNVGQEIRIRIKNLMDNIRKKIERLEECIKASNQGMSSNNKSINAIFNNKADFDPEVYQQSSEKDRHLMLYSLAQKKSNEVSIIAAKSEKALKNFIKLHISKIAEKKGIDIVIDKSAVAYKNSKILDITDNVIKSINEDCKNFVYPVELENINDK